MDWQFTVKWTLLIITLSEGCNHTCPCPCSCLTSTVSTITNPSSSVTNATSTSAITTETTQKPSATSSTASAITSRISKSPSITRTTFSSIHTTPWLNTSNVTCDGSLYTIYKQSNLNYEVINVTGYVGGYVTLKNCTRTDIWHDVEWIKYGPPTHQLCRIGSYHSTSPLNGMCLDCNMTSLTIYNITVEHAGKYVLQRYGDDTKENYYLTVLSGTTTSSPIPDKCKREESNQHNPGSWEDVIRTVKNTNIPLGIHAVWAGIVVSVALIALYMGSRRVPRKPHYTKLPKYDPDEF